MAILINANGKIVTPGLFNPMGQLGLSEVRMVEGTNDAIQRGDDFSASFDIANAYNRRSTVIPITRIEGVTRAAITPSASEPDELGSTSPPVTIMANWVPVVTT